MKRLRLKNGSALRKFSIIRKSALLFIMAIASSITSCEKDKDEPGEDIINAATSMRLVHSSYLSSILSTVNLYVDDVKLNTDGPIVFPGASGYFPATSGSRKIEVKDLSGASIADTLINIVEGKQYSLFIKDRSWIDETSLIVTPLKSGLIAVTDNNTIAPVAGKAKVRFVNASSQPINSTVGRITFSRLTVLGNTTFVTPITQTLGLDNTTFSSDYSTEDAGLVSFRAASANSNVIDLTTTLEAGKLYTLYVVSTEFTVKTPTKSPISLIMLENK